MSLLVLHCPHLLKILIVEFNLKTEHFEFYYHISKLMLNEELSNWLHMCILHVTGKWHNMQKYLWVPHRNIDKKHSRLPQRLSWRCVLKGCSAGKYLQMADKIWNLWMHCTTPISHCMVQATTRLRIFMETDVHLPMLMHKNMFNLYMYYLSW